MPLLPRRAGGDVPVSCVLLAKTGGAMDIVGVFRKNEVCKVAGTYRCIGHAVHKDLFTNSFIYVCSMLIT